MTTETPASSTGRNVTSLHGAVVPDGEPNPNCVAKLEELLERAKAGDVTGIALAALHSDNTASTAVVGNVGPYSLLGAVDMARRDLQDIMKARF